MLMNDTVKSSEEAAVGDAESNKKKRFGIILPGCHEFPGGNDDEFPDIRAGFRERGVTWYERTHRGTSTIFWFYEDQISKLPADQAAANGMKEYVPVDDDDSGHKVCPMDRFLDAHPGEDVECPA